ncbi:MAG: hypothetical protein ACRDJN_25260 [Chloroflexota bacterium]
MLSGTHYVMLDGRVLDLTHLSEAEQQFLERCVEAYRDGVDWLAVGALANGPENPLVRAADGWITPGVWEHPLYQAVRDMEARLAIRQGEMVPGPNDDADRDPFASVDEASPVTLR